MPEATFRIQNSLSESLPLMKSWATPGTATRYMHGSAPPHPGHLNSSVRPSELFQIQPTCLLSRKLLLELHQRRRVRFHVRSHYPLGLVEPNGWPRKSILCTAAGTLRPFDTFQSHCGEGPEKENLRFLRLHEPPRRSKRGFPPPYMCDVSQDR